MVRVRSPLESGCVTMQLALCLRIGLPLVSASLFDSTCGLGQRVLRSSPQPTPDRDDITPLTPNWSATVIGTINPDLRAKPRNMTAIPLSETRKDNKGSLGVKRSVSEARTDCLPSRNSTHQGGKAHQHACTAEVAGDYLNEARIQPSSGTMLNEDHSPSSESSSKPTSTDSNPPSDSSNSLSDVASTSAVTDSDSGSGSTSLNSNALSSSVSNNGSPFGSLPASTSLQDPPSSLRATLPKIDFGSSKDNTPNPTQDSNNNAGMSVSSGNATSPPVEAPPSQQRTKTVAVGVTVPIGVIALGLAALIVLHKQRQRRKKMQHLQSSRGKADEELADAARSPEDQTPTNPVGEAISAVTLAANSGHAHAEPRGGNRSVQEEAEESEPTGSEGASHVSHSTVESPSAQRTAATDPLASRPRVQVPAAADAGAEPARREPKPPSARSRSLRRKPVPVLLESFETVRTMQTSLSAEQEADSTGVSIGLPQRSTTDQLGQ